MLIFAVWKTFVVLTCHVWFIFLEKAEALDEEEDKRKISSLESPHVGELPEFYTQPANEDSASDDPANEHEAFDELANEHEASNEPANEHEASDGLANEREASDELTNEHEASDELANEHEASDELTNERQPRADLSVEEKYEHYVTELSGVETERPPLKPYNTQHTPSSSQETKDSLPKEHLERNIDHGHDHDHAFISGKEFLRRERAKTEEREKNKQMHKKSLIQEGHEDEVFPPNAKTKDEL